MQPPASDRAALRSKLIAARLALTDRLERAVQLQHALRVWLVGRRENTIGAYWPIKGEFDPLPALYRWTEGAPEEATRRIGLPVADRETSQLRFHVWYPGCAMEHDAYDIPKPKDTEEFAPEILVVPCLGFGPGGVRLGYGGGFFDRTLMHRSRTAAGHGGRELHARLSADAAAGADGHPARCDAHRGRRDVAAAVAARHVQPSRRISSSVAALWFIV